MIDIILTTAGVLTCAVFLTFWYNAVPWMGSGGPLYT